MKPKLGPLASLVVALVCAVVCSGYVWFTADTHHRLSTNGASAKGQVTAVRHPVGRFSVDSIDVRVSAHPDDVLVERFSGTPEIGDEIAVRYDRDDPTRMVEEGVSVWGPFEYVMALMAVAGIFSAVVELRRWPRRARRGVPFVPVPRAGASAVGGERPASSWSVKKGRRHRRR